MRLCAAGTSPKRPTSTERRFRPGPASCPQGEALDGDRAGSLTATVGVGNEGLTLLRRELWGTPTHGGLHGLPEGMVELRNALHDDLHDARARLGE
jgi:hypothetical protein